MSNANPTNEAVMNHAAITSLNVTKTEINRALKRVKFGRRDEGSLENCPEGSLHIDGVYVGSWCPEAQNVNVTSYATNMIVYGYSAEFSLNATFGYDETIWDLDWSARDDEGGLDVTREGARQSNNISGDMICSGITENASTAKARLRRVVAKVLAQIVRADEKIKNRARSAAFEASLVASRAKREAKADAEALEAADAFRATGDADALKAWVMDSPCSSNRCDRLEALGLTYTTQGWVDARAEKNDDLECVGCGVVHATAEAEAACCSMDAEIVVDLEDAKPASITYDRWDADKNQWRHFHADLDASTGLYSLNITETDEVGIALTQEALRIAETTRSDEEEDWTMEEESESCVAAYRAEEALKRQPAPRGLEGLSQLAEGAVFVYAENLSVGDALPRVVILTAFCDRQGAKTKVRVALVADVARHARGERSFIPFRDVPSSTKVYQVGS